jgi:glycosyltransferase involved in cell wall biosynthesis
MQPESGAFRKLSVLIAAFNEADTLQPCVERVLAAPLPAALEREIVLVDDGSTDFTGEIAQQLAERHPAVRVFRQPENRGKGAAIRRAIAEMTGDVAILQDADLEYDPADYPRVLRPILDGRADAVFGSRFTGEERKVLYYWHSAGNRLLTTLANMLNDTNLTDMETGYKAFVADCLRAIPLESDRFGIEPELSAKVARNRLRLYEVPVSYNGRTYEEGKKIGWRDGLAALWFIVRYRFSSNYAPVGKMALDALEQAPRFNQWMYDTIQPCLGSRVAELGSGRGNLTKFLMPQREVLVTDYSEEYLEDLRRRWEHRRHLTFAKLDLTQPADYKNVAQFQPDTVVCLNVLEHIEDDRAVLCQLNVVVPAGCRLVFLVPFNPKLFSEFDRQIGHFRRYQKRELEDKMQAAGFAVERQFFFNKVGVFAWWVGNVLFRQRTLTRGQLKLYNALTPLFRVIDRVLPTTGYSTVVVARKPASAS